LPLKIHLQESFTSTTRQMEQTMSPSAIDRTGNLAAVGAVSAVARVSENEARQTAVPAQAPQNSGTGRAGHAQGVAHKALDAGQPPVDPERVVELKRAIEKGDYPLVPAKIADALIAAGMLLQKGA